ncbi:helix-turn-helix transcriptional regulator [Tardiphaga sp. 42S5]|uniref:helix-turn-helix domain-containing protein n=1 Tax=Tardiphaga sp. 42S5 TaxID=1404799 RepID=UPI002A5A3CC3|nr:helix-turn-helix transcriptional regulator [Tardiphaga sp. 42S5]WPO43181.1 helix-turn-helix transcriptional regulator [Tardiphaga sp. 42S5]
MPETALGIWLKELRERRGMSLREAAERSRVDHAYIYRLETGTKEAPSAEVVDKLISALTPPERDAEILRFLVDRTNIDVGLVKFVQGDPTVTFDQFHMMTTVVNRGARPDYATSLARIRKFMT